MDMSPHETAPVQRARKLPGTAHAFPSPVGEKAGVRVSLSSDFIFRAGSSPKSTCCLSTVIFATFVSITRVDTNGDSSIFQDPKHCCRAPRAESAPIHHVFERPVGLLELGFALVVGQRIDSGEADTLGIAEEVFVPAQTVQKGKGVG